MGGCLSTLEAALTAGGSKIIHTINAHIIRMLLYTVFSPFSLYLKHMHSKLTERGRLSGYDHGSVHRRLQLPTSIELLQASDGLLSVHGGRNLVTVLYRERGGWKGGRGEGRISCHTTTHVDHYPQHGNTLTMNHNTAEHLY